MFWTLILLTVSFLVGATVGAREPTVFDALVRARDEIAAWLAELSREHALRVQNERLAILLEAAQGRVARLELALDAAAGAEPVAHARDPRTRTRRARRHGRAAAAQAGRRAPGRDRAVPRASSGRSVNRARRDRRRGRA